MHTVEISMIDNKEESSPPRTNDIRDDNNLPDIFLFWLKVIVGIFGGIIHYFIQRLTLQNFTTRPTAITPYLGLLIGVLIFTYIFGLHVVIFLVLKISKKYWPHFFPPNEVIWKRSLKFSFIFFSIFIISATIMYYIGI